MLKIQDKNILIKRVLVDFVLFALLLISDLVSKDVVMNRLGLSPYRSYTLVNGLFAIYPCYNDGASFSAFSGKTGFLIALTVILMIFLSAIAILNAVKRPKTSWLFRWSMVLLISGGLGNLVDRVFCDGTVRDFIQYLFLDDLFEKLFHTGFGVGNVADIYLVLGVFTICAYIVFDYKEGDLGIFESKKQAVEVSTESQDATQDESKIEEVSATQETANSTQDTAVSNEAETIQNSVESSQTVEGEVSQKQDKE